MRYLICGAALIVATTATAQNSLRDPAVIVRPVAQLSISDQEESLRQVQTTETLPVPTQQQPQIDTRQLLEIVKQLRSIDGTADRATVPTRRLNGISGVQYAAPCDGEECEALQIHMLPQAAPVIEHEVQQVMPQVQMIPRHVPPPSSHSLMYSRDQSFPQLPVVDVDNDVGCGPADHYDLAVICIDGTPTQVLNPEPPSRNCCEVFADNLSRLIHGRDD